MKKIILNIILILGISIFLVPTAAATIQLQQSTILLNKDKVVQLIFPSKIEKYRGGFDPNYFVIDVFSNILYIQPLVSFNTESNITIITEDELIYVFNIKYTDILSKDAYMYSTADAINSTSIQSSKLEIIQKSPLQTLEALQEQPIIENNNAIVDPTLKKVSEKHGYLNSYNGIATKGIAMFLKGIYTNKGFLYFLIEIKNKSYIKYDYAYMGFTVATKTKGKKLSMERNDIEKEDYYIPRESQERGTQRIVYKLPKFTISKDKELIIQLIEKDGERNVFFPINYDIILDAQPI